MKNELKIAYLLAATLLVPAVSRAEVDALPYAADGWRYAAYADEAAVPEEWASPAFDDSEFDVGAMPLGSWAMGTAHCPLASEAQGLWPSPGFLVARRTFTLPRGSTDARIYLGIDNDALVAVNGTVLVADWIRHENCPSRDDFFVDVPRALLNRLGPNMIAVLAHDRGVESWIDVRVAGAGSSPLR